MMKKREGSHALREALERLYKGRPSHLTLSPWLDRVGWLSPPAPYKYYKIEDEWGEVKGGEKQRRTIEREGDKGMKNKERPFKEREILREEVTNKLKKRGGTFERIREDERKKK